MFVRPRIFDFPQGGYGVHWPEPWLQRRWTRHDDARFLDETDSKRVCVCRKNVGEIRDAHSAQESGVCGDATNGAVRRSCQSRP